MTIVNLREQSNAFFFFFGFAPDTDMPERVGVCSKKIIYSTKMFWQLCLQCHFSTLQINSGNFCIAKAKQPGKTANSEGLQRGQGKYSGVGTPNASLPPGNLSTENVSIDWL